MHYAYLAAGLIMLTIWLILFVRRKDLRRKMLTTSLIAAPLGFFDSFAVPRYWQPVTMFDLPIGFEGILYSFCLGGITAIFYSHVTNTTPQRMKRYQKVPAIIVLVTTLSVLALLYTQQPSWNPAVMLYIALLCGLAVMLYFRTDLVKSTVFGALLFGVLYFFILRLWITLFPGVVEWFAFEGLPKVFVIGVPAWELLFGIIFAAYWGNVYEMLFGFRQVGRTKAK